MTADLINRLMALKPLTARGWERGEDGNVIVLVPKFNGRILARYLMPRLKEPYFRIRLDQLGSFVWERCDGHHTGEAMAAAMQERFPGIEKPRERTAMFLRTLAGQGHIKAL